MNAERDEHFEETTISKVRADGDGWTIERADGWSFFVPAESPIEPKEGMSARFYGKGIGHSVRGLFLGGVKVFYRTEAEEKEKQEIDLYGADAADWLRRWDDGRTVWTIEMGGLGPGYEQCIHITAAEILRHLLDAQYDAAAWADQEVWKRDRDQIENYGFKNKVIEGLGGITGAQWGAALNLATQFYKRGPRELMKDERVKDRKIQVSRKFPVAA